MKNFQYYLLFFLEVFFFFLWKKVLSLSYFKRFIVSLAFGLLSSPLLMISSQRFVQLVVDPVNLQAKFQLNILFNLRGQIVHVQPNQIQVRI